MVTKVIRLKEETIDALHKVDNDIDKAVTILLQKCNNTVTNTPLSVTNCNNAVTEMEKLMPFMDLKRRLQAAENKLNEHYGLIESVGILLNKHNIK